MSNAPPGWYPDPENPGQQRWWDGVQWAAPQPAVATTASPSDTGAVQSTSTQSTRRAQSNALGVIGLVLALLAIVAAFLGPAAMLSWLFGIPAIVLGITGLVLRGKTRGMAIAAVTVSACSLLIGPIVAVASTSGTPPSIAAGASTSDSPSAQPSDQPSESASTPSRSPVAADTSAYETLSDHDFALMAKDPESWNGRQIIVFGVVTQFDSATGKCSFLADTGASQQADSFSYAQNTALTADSDHCAQLANVVEDDHLKIYAVVDGSISYDTQSGGNTTVPQLSVINVEELPPVD
jgi:hypothetical protein